MPVKLRLKVVGDRHAQRVIASLRRPGAEPAIRRSLNLAATRVKRGARRRHLLGQTIGIRTGRLRGSITIDDRHLPRFIDIGTALPQAGPLHFGWPSKWRRYRAAPFLLRPFDEETRDFPKLWADELEKHVRKTR
jgi:hypothetical protein